MRSREQEEVPAVGEIHVRCWTIDAIDGMADSWPLSAKGVEVKVEALSINGKTNLCEHLVLGFLLQTVTE